MSIRKMITPIILALAALVALGPTSAAAEDHRTTYPLQGKVRGIVSVNVQSLEIIGISRGKMSHVGKTLTHMRGTVAPPGVPYTGPFTILARNNSDRITGTYSLIGGAPNPNFHPARMTLTITGGTGRYSGATGSISGEMQLTPFEFPTAVSPYVLETIEAATRGYITY
jgi:hypothetical protein